MYCRETKERQWKRPTAAREEVKATKSKSKQKGATKGGGGPGVGAAEGGGDQDAIETVERFSRRLSATMQPVNSPVSGIGGIGGTGGSNSSSSVGASKSSIPPAQAALHQREGPVEHPQQDPPASVGVPDKRAARLRAYRVAAARRACAAIAGSPHSQERLSGES